MCVRVLVRSPDISFLLRVFFTLQYLFCQRITVQSDNRSTFNPKSFRKQPSWTPGVYSSGLFTPHSCFLQSSPASAAACRVTPYRFVSICRSPPISPTQRYIIVQYLHEKFCRRHQQHKQIQEKISVFSTPCIVVMNRKLSYWDRLAFGKWPLEELQFLVRPCWL